MPDIYTIILALEVASPFILLSIVLSIVVFRRKKQDKKSLQLLVANFKDNAEGREKSILDFLEHKVGLDDPVKTEASKGIISARKSFLQNIIKAFLTRESEAISNIDNDLSNITSSYQNMSMTLSQSEESDTSTAEAAADENPTVPVEVDPNLTADIERLKKENKDLKIEVHTTLSTLNNIFAQYTSMFGEESDKKDMSVDEILGAMESFGSDDVESASSAEASPEPEASLEPEAAAEPEASLEPETIAEPEAAAGHSGRQRQL